jgi:hypothetical protein
MFMSSILRSTANKNGEPRRWLETVRRFIDGEHTEDLGLEIEPAPVAKPRERDLFFKNLARQISELLNQEAFGPPNIPLTLPPEITVFVAPDINRNWLNQVRRRLLDGLEAAIKQRVKEMAGSMPSRTLPPRIVLAEDAALDLGGIRLEARWHLPANGDVVQDSEETEVHLGSTETEATIVLNQGEPLYSLDLFLAGNFQRRIPIFRSSATIGRSARTQPADIHLDGSDVSRRHATLECDATGLWVTALGQNGTRVGRAPLERRHRRRLRLGESVEICEFRLQLVEMRAMQ